MPTTLDHNQLEPSRCLTHGQENGLTPPTPSQMIRVDYQKKGAPLPVTPGTPIPPPPATTHLQDNQVRSSTSPVSSIQEEFYSYLGISSTKSSGGDSDADFDLLSKRRSLRVRVVNKLKEHQAKLQAKMAENSNGSSPELNLDASREAVDNRILIRTKEEVEGNSCTVQLRRYSRLDSQCSSNGTTPSPNSSSTTILARRCYFTKSTGHSHSPTPSNFQPFNPSSSSSPPMFLSPVPPPLQSTPPDEGCVEVFSDFEEELKKQMQLTAAEGLGTASSTTTSTTTDVTETTTSSTPPSASVVKSPRPQKRGKKGKVIKKRLLMRRQDFATHRKRSQSSSTWDAMNNNNNNSNSNKKLKRVIQVPTIVSVNLKKFQTKPTKVPEKPPPPVAAAAAVPLPEFTVIQKVDEVRPYTVLDAPERQESSPGPVLGTYYDEKQGLLLVVTARKVAFFQHHATVALFQRVVVVPSAVKNGHLPKPPPCTWSQLDVVDRMQRDEMVDELMFEKRIMVAGGAGIVYAELRAQRLVKDREYRTGEMSAAYLNVYHLCRSGEDEDGDWAIEAKTIALDTVVALPADISYAILPQEPRSLVMCWTERQLAKKRIGCCRYTLSEDLATLEMVAEFQAVDGELNGVRWSSPGDYVIGTGNNQISIWDSRTGLLLSNIVLTDFELGETLYAQVLNVDRQERHLLLVQCWENYLNVVHVNLLDFAYRVLRSRELSCTRAGMQSVVRVEAGDGANVILGLVVVKKGWGRDGKGEVDDGPQESLELFDALTNRLVVMQRQGSEEVVGGGRSRLFLNARYLVKVGDRLAAESISIQPVSEFLFNLI